MAISLEAPPVAIGAEIGGPQSGIQHGLRFVVGPGLDQKDATRRVFGQGRATTDPDEPAPHMMKS